MIAMSEAELEGLPPAAILVYKILEYEGPQLTQDEIADHAPLPKVTIRTALYRLEDDGFVDDDIVYMDTRRKVYSTVK